MKSFKAFWIIAVIVLLCCTFSKQVSSSFSLANSRLVKRASSPLANLFTSANSSKIASSQFVIQDNSDDSSNNSLDSNTPVVPTTTPASKTTSRIATTPTTPAARTTTATDTQTTATITTSTTIETTSASVTPTPSDGKSSSSGEGTPSSNTGLIIGLSVAGGVVVLVLVGIYIFRKWKLRPSSDFKNRAVTSKAWQPQTRTAQSDRNFLRELNDDYP